MGEVSLDMIWKRLEEMQAGQDGIRAELVTLNETVRSLVRADVAIQRNLAAMQRDMVVLKDRMNILAQGLARH